MLRKLALSIVVAAACRGDLITFGSNPADVSAIAASGPVGVVETTQAVPGPVFEYSGWVTPAYGVPAVLRLAFDIPADFDIVGASLSFQSNGPAAGILNGLDVSGLTYSTIANVLGDVHDGENVFTTPAAAALVAANFQFDVWGYYEGWARKDPPAAGVASEPGSIWTAAGGLMLLLLGFALRRGRVHKDW